jgi:hypothetical protein
VALCAQIEHRNEAQVSCRLVGVEGKALYVLYRVYHEGLGGLGLGLGGLGNLVGLVGLAGPDLSYREGLANLWGRVRLWGRAGLSDRACLSGLVYLSDRVYLLSLVYLLGLVCLLDPASLDHGDLCILCPFLGSMCPGDRASLVDLCHASLGTLTVGQSSYRIDDPSRGSRGHGCDPVRDHGPCLVPDPFHALDHGHDPCPFDRSLGRFSQRTLVVVNCARRHRVLWGRAKTPLKMTRASQPLLILIWLCSRVVRGSSSLTRS